MKRFVRLCFLILMAMVVLCTATIGLTRAQPLAKPVPNLDQCDNLPCVLSISAEHTSWQDAQAAFAYTRTASIKDQEITVWLNSGIQLSLEASDDHRRVDLVSIDFSASAPTLGMLIAYYGPPCMVTINPYMRYIAVRFPYFTAYINHLDSYPAVLSPEVHIDSLDLYGTADACRVQDRSQDRLWQGFAKIPYYPVRLRSALR